MKGIVFFIGCLLVIAGVVGLIVVVCNFSGKMLLVGALSLCSVIAGYHMWVAVDDHSDDQML